MDRNLAREKEFLQREYTGLNDHQKIFHCQNATNFENLIFVAAFNVQQSMTKETNCFNSRQERIRRF